MPPGEITLAQVLGTITDLGTIGVLLTVVWWFVNGKIVSKATMDQTLEQARVITDNAQKEFQVRQQMMLGAMKDAIKDSVRDGILEARGELIENIPCVRDVRAKDQTRPRS